MPRQFKTRDELIAAIGNAGTMWYEVYGGDGNVTVPTDYHITKSLSSEWVPGTSSLKVISDWIEPARDLPFKREESRVEVENYFNDKQNHRCKAIFTDKSLIAAWLEEVKGFNSVGTDSRLQFPYEDYDDYDDYPFEPTGDSHES